LTNAYPDASSPYPMYGRFIREMVEHLTQSDLAVSVVTPRLFRQSRAYEVGEGERVYRFWFWSDNRLLIQYERTPVLRMVTYIVSGVLKGLRVVQKDSCCLIHAHWAFPAGLIAVAVGLFLKRPVVLTVHGSDARWAFEKKGLFRVLFRWAAMRAQFVTTVSQNISQRMLSMGMTGERIVVFPMGVSDQFFTSGKRARPGSQRDGTVTVLSTRHLLPLYNVECLIRAIPHVLSRSESVLFLVANDGERRAVLESMARKMKLLPWVRFLGSIPHGQMPALLNSSDIYVSTSPADGASVSLLEAMACGLFPVVTDIPANREWIRDGENGFLVPTHDELALADKIHRAIEDEGLREKARQINVRLVREKASWERVSQILREIYDSVMSPSESYM
jgi:glycosyltransferase involved in cell wall biosynthesis